MNKILIDQNPHWLGPQTESYIKRAVYESIKSLFELDEILVLLGVRRCGKTTLAKLLIEDLSKGINPKSIVYVNLDDPYFANISTDASQLYNIVEDAEKITGVRCDYLFLDEIQNITAWEKFIKSVYDSKVYKKIVVTGSNSYLLKSDYATLLSGRYIEQAIYPLSFSELCQHHNLMNLLELTKNKSKTLSLFESMLYYGGFPRCHLIEDASLKRKILANYYETILLKDCIAANTIRDPEKLSQLAHYLLTNAAARYSYAKLSSFLGSNEHTIKSYIIALQNSLLIEEVLNFSYSLKEQSKSNRKPFCIDNGFITAVAYEFVMKEGKLFENLVYSELKKQGINNLYIFFNTKECDFIVKHKGQTIAIQVCYKLTPENQQREIKSLEYAMQQTHADKGVIITYDDELLIENNIQVNPFWKLFGVSPFVL